MGAFGPPSSGAFGGPPPSQDWPPVQDALLQQLASAFPIGSPQIAQVPPYAPAPVLPLFQPPVAPAPPPRPLAPFGPSYSAPPASPPPPPPPETPAGAPAAPTPSTTPDASDLKILSRDEINRLKAGGVDIHRLKGQESGTDLYKDRQGGIYILPQGGQGEPDPTEHNINDFGRRGTRPGASDDE